MSAYAAADQPAIYSEEGRALKKRIEEAGSLPQGLAELLHGADEIVTEIERLNSNFNGAPHRST